MCSIFELFRVTYDEIMKQYHWNPPIWFNIKDYNSLPVIITAHLEQIIQIKYDK